MKLKNKVVVITGSSRGIGKAIALSCAREGASVVVSSRSADSVKKTVSEIKSLNLNASGIPCDVSSPEDLQQLFDHATNTWGNIDVWVNNAGIASGFRTLHSQTSDEIKQVVDVNLFGTLNACRMMIPYFMKKGGGIILNMSGWGGRGEAPPYVTVYAATKAAVTSLTKSLAKENRKHPLSINCVLPGMIETDIYKDLKVSPETEKLMKYMPVLVRSLTIPLETVGKLFVELAAQKPGKRTGKVYSLSNWRRMVRGVFLMFYYLFVKGEFWKLNNPEVKR